VVQAVQRRRHWRAAPLQPRLTRNPLGVGVEVGQAMARRSVRPAAVRNSARVGAVSGSRNTSLPRRAR
jgi:hypothetical protein